MSTTRKLLVILLVFLATAVIVTLVLLTVILAKNKTNQTGNSKAAQPGSESLQASPKVTPFSLEGDDSLAIALDSLSSERMYKTLEDLTSIQVHSGWRGGGTTGEKEALDYLQTRLNEMQWLTNRGMTQERESFHVFFGTEDHTSSVFFSDGNQMVEIPADAIRGHRDDPSSVIHMDSDGQFNGINNDPLILEGPTTLIPDDNALNTLVGSNQRGNILLVDYNIVDTVNPMAMTSAAKLFELEPGAIVLVTSNSNEQGVTHGSFAGDGGGVIQRLVLNKTVPVVFIEIENLAEMGVTDWDSMEKLTQSRVVWDTDVLNPAESGNLIVHIPGKNPSRPVLISAHIDSPNSPGALDDGSGSAILLEIATILNNEELQPEVDLYLAWYGSEELGIYGSTYFTTTHSDLVNSLQANIQLDCLSRPMDGMTAKVTLMFSHTSPTASSLTSDPLGRYLINRANDLQIETHLVFWPFASDNGSLSAFNVPNLDIIYESDEMDAAPGGVWVTGHFHDPYDTVETAREVEGAFLEMARLALSGAFIPSSEPVFVERSFEKQAVFIASHTEAPHMTPTGLPEFSLALINAGYEIKVVPFGDAVTTDDISGAELVVVLPSYDYPMPGSAGPDYDTNWTAEEVAVIDEYVRAGGKLMVVNSAKRLKLYNRVFDLNEDWADLNTLTSQWGVQFITAGSETFSLNVKEDALMDGVRVLNVTPENTVAFSMTEGKVLAGETSKAYLAEIKLGSGDVIILGDLTVLGENSEGLINPVFVNNFADW